MLVAQSRELHPGRPDWKRLSRESLQNDTASPERLRSFRSHPRQLALDQKGRDDRVTAQVRQNRDKHHLWRKETLAVVPVPPGRPAVPLDAGLMRADIRLVIR